MELIDKYWNKFGFVELEEIRIVRKIKQKTGMSAGLIFTSLTILLIIMALQARGRAIIEYLTTYVYPAYKTYKSMANHDRKAQVRWLDYWIIYAFFYSFDHILKELFGMPGKFCIAKVIILNMMHLIGNNSIAYVFDRLIEPTFDMCDRRFGGLVDWFDNTIMKDYKAYDKVK